MATSSVRRPLILAVDDEPLCLRALRDTLMAGGYRVIPATSGREALAMLEEREPDLVILDLRMPDLNGHEVCERIRTFSTVPVIVVTALAQEADKVRALDLGADDYVTKPYSVNELLARVRAALRRAEQQPAPTQRAPRLIRAGDLAISDAEKRVLKAGVEVRLSPTEYRLLWELASNAGRLVTRELLMERVWGKLERNAEEALKCAVRRLRRRLSDDPSAPRYIASKRGFGYVFVAPVVPGEREREHG